MQKTFKASDLLDAEIQINDFIKANRGELLTAQVEYFENGIDSHYAVIIVYKQNEIL